MFGLIPMPHRIKVQSPGGFDDWGLPINGGESKEYAARIDYNTARDSILVSAGKEVVFTATILMNGLPSISYEDTIRWDDELGNVREMKPISLEPKSDLSGNPLVLKVVV